MSLITDEEEAMGAAMDDYFMEHKVRASNRVHARFPSDPDSRARLDKVRKLDAYYQAKDPMPFRVFIAAALVVFSFMGLCVLFVEMAR